MKKLCIVLVMMFCLTGCATTKVATDIGTIIGNSYQESAIKGLINAEQSIKAWPYISGQLKGLMAGDYALDIQPRTKGIIDKLDIMAAKKTLTDEEKGFIIGSFVRLEAVAIKDGWNKYGVSIFQMIKRTIGG